MCRMMALRSEDAGVRRELLARFRTQADRGFTGPDDHRSHRDGWGMVGLTRQGLSHLGRNPVDATTDPLYPEAVRRSDAVESTSIVVAHVRNASVGKKTLPNTHPFLRAGWAFCHNGTIQGTDAPVGFAAEGDTDSERFFLQILAARARADRMESAIRSVVERLEKQPYSSLDFLLTDGRELYAFRRVGPDPGSCGTRECALEHYALGFGRWRDALVILQEPQLLPDLEGWIEVPDGALLHVPRGGAPRIQAILPAIPQQVASA